MSREIALKLQPHMGNLRSVTRPAGEAYIDRYLPELDGQDREYAVSQCGINLTPQFKIEPQDALFVTAMFMAGVSQGDLAALFGITKQSIQVKIYRHTTKAERTTLREYPVTMDLEAIAIAREIYYVMAKDNPALVNKSPSELGRSLLTAANSIMMQDRGDDFKPIERPRRYAKSNISQSGKELATEIVANAPEYTPIPSEPTPTQKHTEMPLNKKGELSKLTDLDAPKRIQEKDKMIDTAFDQIFASPPPPQKE